MTAYVPINFRRKLGLFAEQWQPRVVAEMNDYQFKLVKLQGDFVWHDHKDTDRPLSCWKAKCGSTFAMVR
jgi:hypothetical protein